MQKEATEQTQLLKYIGTDMEDAVSNVEGRTRQAAEANAQSRKGFFWLYVLIAVELYVLCTILIKYS